MPPFTQTTTTTIQECPSKVEKTTEIYSKKINTAIKDPRRTTKYKCFLGEFETELIWVNIIGIALLNVYALHSLITYDWTTLASYKLVLWQFLIGGFGGFGITAGAHRYWTHRSYKATLPLRIILVVCYSVAGQNTILEWVRDHRVHHKFSETVADPHDSNRGFFFAHVGWLMMRKHPEVIRKGQQIDCNDIFDDPLVVFLQKNWTILKTVFCFLLPSILPTLLWGEPLYNGFIANCTVRYCMNLHFTWFVNSAAHLWGNRPYDKTINPVENLSVSILAMGEGWHNYHHAFPWDYKAAELGNYKVNVTTMWLDFFAKLGWAYDLKYPSEDLVRKVIQKTGDGSHPHHHQEIPENSN